MVEKEPVVYVVNQATEKHAPVVLKRERTIIIKLKKDMDEDEFIKKNCWPASCY